MLGKINQKSIYHASYLIYYIAYILSLIGFQLIAPKYLEIFTATVKIYISLLLMWRFNPFIKIKPVTKYDRELIFSSAMFLLLTTTVGDLLMSWRKNIGTESKLGLFAAKNFLL